MPNSDEWRDEIASRLRTAGVEVEPPEDTFELTYGQGEAARTVNVDPEAVVTRVASQQPDEAERTIKGWTQGVVHALLEPADSDGDDWGFKQAASTIYPMLVSPPFIDGAERAAGESLWTREFPEDLRFVYVIELDSGIRLLSRQQFAGWSATEDRVTSAGRSLLYHKSRQSDPEPADAGGSVETFRAGDGYDAARITIIQDLLFGEFDSDSRLAIPASGRLLFVRDATDSAVEALGEACDDAFADADIPLTRTLFRFDRSDIVPADS